MDTILKIITREYRYLFSKKIWIFFVMVFPLLYGFFLGQIYSQKVVKKMPIAVLDNDNSKLSRLLLNYVQSSRSFNIVAKGRSLEDVKTDLYRENIVAFLDIPRGFQKNIKKLTHANLTMFVSGSNYMLANLSKTEMQTIVQTIAVGTKLKVLGKSLGIPKQKAMAIANPINVEMVRVYNPWFNYLDFLGPGFWVAALHQIMLLLGSLLICREFERRSFYDLYTLSKQNLGYLFIGKLSPYIGVMFVIFLIYFVLIFAYFDVPITGSLPVLIVYSLLFIICSFTFGLVLSTVLWRSVDSLKGVLLIGSPAFLVSGYTWPLESMPGPIQFIAECIPITPYCAGYRKLYDEAGGILEVIPSGLHMLVLSLVCVIISYVALKVRVKHDQNYLDQVKLIEEGK